MRNGLKYRLALLMLGATFLAGCSEAEEAAVESTTSVESDMAQALPQAGEASESTSNKDMTQISTTVEDVNTTNDSATKEDLQAEKTETTQEVKKESSKKNNKKATKGTITVATVGSPNTEILQQAAVLLEEKGYGLKIEVCEDYLTPNQMLVDGSVNCNYYQHEAFLERYNIEHQTTLVEVAKIHYEPLMIYSEQLESLEQVKNGMKVAISNNPTAISRALWLLQDVGLVTLMSDADINTVKDDVAENPYGLEFVFVEENELVAQLQAADLVLCDKDLLMKEAVDDEELLLAVEEQDAMMAGKLSQIIVANDVTNQKAQMLADVLLSDEMEEFVTTNYQGSVVMIAEEVVEMEEENAEEN